MSQNEWIHDQRLDFIPEDKKEFLHTLLFEMNQLSQDEKLPFIMALLQSKKLERINFSQEELSLLAQVLRDYADEQQVKSMEHMMRLLKMK